MPNALAWGGQVWTVGMIALHEGACTLHEQAALACMALPGADARMGRQGEAAAKAGG